MADLKEQCAIAEERTQNAIADREKFQDKNREYIHKMQTMKDQIEDRNLTIEENEAKINLLKDENKVLKDGQEVFQRKFADIYENHILIAKGDNSNKNTNQHEEDE